MKGIIDLFSIASADIALCVLPLSEVLHRSSTELKWTRPAELGSSHTCDTFYLLNKADLVHFHSEEIAQLPSLPGPSWIVSLANEDGTSTFMDGLSTELRSRFDAFLDGREPIEPLITHSRHREHLTAAVQYIDAFLKTGMADTFSLCIPY